MIIFIIINLSLFFIIYNYFIIIIFFWYVLFVIYYIFAFIRSLLLWCSISKSIKIIRLYFFLPIFSFRTRIGLILIKFHYSLIRLLLKLLINNFSYCSHFNDKYCSSSYSFTFNLYSTSHFFYKMLTDT